MPEPTMTVTDADIDLSQSADSGGDDVETGAESEETATETTGYSTETQGSETQESEIDESAPVIEFSPKEIADFGRMANALKSRQEENAQLREQLANVQKAQSKQSDADDDHPALKGLKADDDGDYFVNGRYVSRDELISEYEREDRIARLEAKLEANERQAAEKQAQAELQAAQEELRDNIVKTVTNMRAKVFADVPEDKVGKIDRQLLRMLDDTLEGKLSEEGVDFGPELLQSSIAEVFEEARDLFGVYGAKQLQDNQTTKTTMPVKPGVPGGEKPVDPLSMTKKAAQSLADAAAAAIDKARGRSG